MSMHDYAVDDYGLVFNGNHLEVLAAQLFDDYSAQDFDANMYDYIDSLVEKLGIECISNFTGGAIPIEDDGTPKWSGADYYCSDSIYYLSVSNHPTLFKAAYSSADDVIKEFKDKVGKYLPGNFPYRNCLRHIVGTHFYIVF